ncbi:MAG TPA: MlaD family protein [Solirubrobacteraceae bacterium]|jgi:phospholipid/cholesterol/gamma-HCH transport system substrate-binding protein|nr:MlaD family protein [Solirubrobacteraceae bacterium]
MLARQIERYAKWVVAIVVIMVLAVLSSIYVLSHERLRWPFQASYEVNAVFSSVDAVAPGLGEPVNVAGVRVGQISGASLQHGQGVLRLSIDPGKLPRLYANARAVLVPNTPLKDMQVDIVPGGAPAPVLRHGGTIPLAQTTVPIDSDDFLKALDTDTRTWFTGLVADLDQGTRGRTRDIAALLRALGPTTGQVHQIAHLLAARRGELARVVHNLGAITQATAVKDRELATLVDTSNATLGALASQDVALRASLARLPGTLSTARRTLGDATTFARALAPTLDALTPTARRSPRTLRDTRALIRGASGLPVDKVRPFIDAVLPLAADIGPASRAIAASTPPLIDATKVLDYFSNEIAYNPGGANQGYLYWLAWFSHNGASVFSTEDAHGAVARGLGLFSCSSLSQPGSPAQLMGLLFGVSPTACSHP